MFPILLAILLSAFMLPLTAQDFHIKFKRLSEQDRLSRSWVKCIFQDRTGYLWIGTAEGLYKYDGVRFKIYKYNAADSTSLNHNNTNIIFEDSRGDLWIGTQAGLNLYDRERDRFNRVTSINNYISCIYEFSHGNFLVGTAGGLFLLNPQDFSARQLYYDFYAAKFLRDKNKNFWMATHKGLMLLDTTDFSYITIKTNDDQGLGNREIIMWSIYEDSRGGIWIGTATDGLIYMKYTKDDPRNPSFRRFVHDPKTPGSINQGTIYSISEDEGANLWIGIENGGINIVSLDSLVKPKVSFTHFDHDPFDPFSISNNSIHSIYKDRQNTIWIGTYSSGISYYNSLLLKFGHYKSQHGNRKSINDNHVNVIFEEDDYLWIGTEGGLNIYDKEKRIFRYFRNKHDDNSSLGSNAIWAICRDSRNNMWIGAWEGGLNEFHENTNTFTRYLYDENNPNSIGGNNINGIIEDRDGYLWLASMRGGLNRFDTETKEFVRFKEDFNHNSISCDWVNSVLEGSDGNIWISTTEAVDLYNKKTNHFTTFIHNPAYPKSISYNGAICLYEDSRKNIWIGTSNGLNLFIKADSSFRCYQQTDGLPDNIIKAIVEDDHGNLWLSTNQGISKFFNGINVPDKPVFRNYTVSDGLQANEFNSGAVFKNKEGMIYFGGNNGYNVFHPDNIRDNPYIPNIVFTNLLIYNKPVTIGGKDSPLQHDISVAKEIRLTRKHSVFTIEFASLNLLAPENNRYAFYLEGFEKDWNYVGNQRSATYTNLDHGRYTFRVKASNNDGLWNEEGISLRIVVEPAWWQTIFAKVIFLLIILMAIYYFRKNTIISVNLKNELWKEHLEKQKSEELNQMKQQFFTNISHELRTPLTLIIGPLKQLLSQKVISAQVEMIYRNATRLKILVDQIMDFSKIENQMMKLNPSTYDIVEYSLGLISNFSDFSGQKNITLRVKSTMKKCIVTIDEDKFEKIITNIISNGIKHTSEGGRIDMSIDYDKQNSMLKIDISDTGKGIPPDEIDHIFDRFYTSSDHLSAKGGTGIGLNLTKRLIELHKGTISVSSTVGKGTTFSIRIPVKVSEIDTGIIEKIVTEHTSGIQQQNLLKQPTFHHENSILVIDDNPEMCDYIESLLSDEFDVIKENDPVESINHIIRYLPDVIISDVMMPDFDGFQLCRLVKNDVRFSHIPVILLTAKATTQDHITGYETGADDYIYKPFEGEILKARIRNLIMQKEKLRKQFIGDDGVINKEANANPLDISFIDQIVALINDNYGNPDYSVNDIIEKMAMSRSIFYKKFKSLSDQSVNDIIKNIRLKKSIDLLNTGKYKINEAAYNCGFSDPAYFSRVFKETYKLSPKEYLQQHNGNAMS